jgi:hypothetical protein
MSWHRNGLRSLSSLSAGWPGWSSRSTGANTWHADVCG